MSTTQKPSYPGSSTTVTNTGLTTLASSATVGWQSNAIDNAGADLALAALIRVSVTVANTAPANDKTVYVFVYESENGSQYTDNATGSVGGLTIRDPTNLKLIGTIACPTQNLAYEQVFTYAPMVMPRKWGLVIINFTGMAFTAATVTYTPVQGQSG